jgi:hypothetical protein
VGCLEPSSWGPAVIAGFVSRFSCRSLARVGTVLLKCGLTVSTIERIGLAKLREMDQLIGLLLNNSICLCPHLEPSFVRKIDQ